VKHAFNILSQAIIIALLLMIIFFGRKFIKNRVIKGFILTTEIIILFPVIIGISVFFVQQTKLQKANTVNLEFMFEQVINLQLHKKPEKMPNDVFISMILSRKYKNIQVFEINHFQYKVEMPNGKSYIITLYGDLPMHLWPPAVVV
jgi:hypothetical protein